MNRSNRARAFGVIDGLRGDRTLRELAREAGVALRTMSRFLTEAKKKDIVENHVVIKHNRKISVWRRKRDGYGKV